MAVAKYALQPGLEEILVDPAREAVAGHHVEGVVHDVGVAVVSGHDRKSRPRAEGAAPLEGGVEVGIMEGRVPVEGETVPGPVCIGLDGVPVVHAVRDGAVQVAERGPSARIGAFLGEQAEYPVGIGGAASYDEGRTVLLQRSFEVETAGQQSEAERALDLLGVALAAADVQHGRDPAAELRGDGTLVQFDVVDDVGIERGEDAEEVAGVVDGAVVEQDEVLVGRASADVEAAGGLSDALHAGQRQDSLHHVGLTEGGRYLGDGVDADLLDAHAGVAVVHHALCGDHCLLEGGDALLHHDVETAVAVDHDVEVQVLEGIPAEAEDVLAQREAHAEAAVVIGHGIST